jgi:hypothetical protein
MPLLQLPPEILREIFHLVGATFFRQDIYRLTISKSWYQFARLTYYDNIQLNQDNLLRFISISSPQKTSLLKTNLHILKISITIYEFQASPGSGTVARNEGSPSTGSYGYDRTEVAENHLYDGLARLAAITQRAQSLHHLQINVWTPTSNDVVGNPKVYVQPSMIQSLLQVQSLATLVLDIPYNLSKNNTKPIHLCAVISDLLPQLRRLRLRMYSICPDVLKLRNPDCTLHLSELIINLSLKIDLPGITSASHSKRCQSPGGGLLQLRTDLQHQAEELAGRMVSPKLMRVLSQPLPGFRTQSFDILTGKTTNLDEGMDWNEDGSTLEESESESDFSDEDYLDF